MNRNANDNEKEKKEPVVQSYNSSLDAYSNTYHTECKGTSFTRLDALIEAIEKCDSQLQINSAILADEIMKYLFDVVAKNPYAFVNYHSVGFFLDSISKNLENFTVRSTDIFGVGYYGVDYSQDELYDMFKEKFRSVISSLVDDEDDELVLYDYSDEPDIGDYDLVYSGIPKRLLSYLADALDELGVDCALCEANSKLFIIFPI